MSSDKPWTAREVDKCAEHGLCGGFAVGGLWCCPVSRGEDEERCTVSFRLTSRRNAELCLVSCVGVVGDEEIPEAFLAREKSLMLTGDVEGFVDSLEDERNIPVKLRRREHLGEESLLEE